MRSSGRHIERALAALALLLAMPSSPTFAADLLGHVRELFDAGSTTSPSAASAAKSRYEKLKAAYQSDPRIDYAYGVVLVNQHKYREAGEVLVRYLTSDEPDVAAYCLYISSLVPRSEFGKALEQADLLARRLAVEAGGATVDDRQDAAAFLGTLFRYLELPRKGAVDNRLLARSKQDVLTSLDEQCHEAFEQGYNSVARRLSELQAEHESHVEKRIEKITNRKVQDQLAIEDAEAAGKAAHEKAQLTEEELRDVRRQYAELQKQMSPFVSQSRTIESTIVIRQAQLDQGTRDRTLPGPVAQGLQNEILLLRQQLNELARRFRVLQVSAAALEAQAAEHHFSLANAEKKSRDSQRRGFQANRRVERADGQLAERRQALSGKLTSFATYAPFSYELEQKRVLDWFSKQDGTTRTLEAP